MATLVHSKSFFEQELILSTNYLNRDRLEVFRNLCNGKRVLHVGCVDWPITDPNNNLHIFLDSVCAALDGLDTRREAFHMIQPLIKGRLFSSVAEISEPYDLLLVPEVIEHVGDVASFLREINTLQFDEIVITAPDAAQCASRHFRLAASGQRFSELVHPDHNCWYSPYTLYNTIRKYTSWEVLELGLFNKISILIRARKTNTLSHPGIKVPSSSADVVIDDSGSVTESAYTEKSGEKNLLIACDFFWPSVGGVESVAAQLAQRFSAAGYSVDVATRWIPDRTEHKHNGANIISIPVPDGFTPWESTAVANLRDLILSGRYQTALILADPLSWPLWAVYGLPENTRTRVVVQPIINQAGYEVWRKADDFIARLDSLLMRADSVVSLTEHGIESQYLKEKGILETCIPNATSGDRSAFDLRQSLGITKSVPVLLQVANLWQVKNHLNLLKVLRGTTGNWHFVLIGRATADEAYVRLIEHALSLDPRVHWLRDLSDIDVRAAMAESTILLVPSLAEVSPVVVIEAMSQGLPWISTPNCGGILEFEGGIVTTLEKFPEQIANLLSDEHERRKLSIAGLHQWKAQFNWDTIFPLWEKTLFPAHQSASPVRTTSPRLHYRFQTSETIQPSGVILTQMPLVSVIVPTFNRPHLLRRALESIRLQTYHKVEVIVINDNGVSVETVLDDFKNTLSITYCRHASNFGLSAARNSGLKLASGEIITYLDDDDTFEPHHVSTVVEAMARTGADFVYTESDYVIERLDNGQIHELQRRKQFDDCSYSRQRLFIANFIPVNTWAHRRQIIDQIGKFDETLRNLEDWDLLLRYARHKDPVHIPMVTVAVHHRAQADNMLAAYQGKFLPHYIEIYRRHDDLGDVVIAQGRKQLLDDMARRESIAPTRPALPWLPEGRWLPAECDWAQQAMAVWQQEAAAIPSFGLVVMPSAKLSTQPTRQSLAAQWLTAKAVVELPASALAADALDAANAALRDSGAEWLGLIDAGDQLAPDALFRLAHAIRHQPQWQFVYTDEDSLTPDGQHVNPHCKPDFNLDYLRSLPYIGGLLLIRRDLFEALGGFASQAEGAEDYDLLLRAWEHLQQSGAGEAAIGHVPEVLYHRLQGSGHTQKSVPEILAAGQETLQRHFARLGIAAQVQPGPFPPAFRVRWPLPEAKPLVSILIPTRDQLPLLQRCVESVIEKTRYPAYEILLIDNDSQTPEARNYLAAIEAKEAELGGRLRVLRHPGAFNFSAMNNAAAAQARGEYLLLLNNGTAALHDDWLDEMMGHAVRPDVGIVGAKLLDPDGKIQHAGVILGLRGPAEHPFIGHPPEDRGYFGRAQLTQNLSAVTGACLLVRKSVYEQVGGLDEQAFKVSYNDIDLCLKVREAGYRIVFTPFALLMHEGSASQKSGTETKPDDAKLKRFAAEKEAMYAKWLPQLADDPAYNRHLSLVSTDFLLDDQPCVSWSPQWRPRPRVLVHPADREGCGEYRIIAPMRALNRAGLTQGWETMRLFDPAEMQRIDPDTLVVQRQMEWPQIEALERHAKYSRAFRVFEIDDLITNLPLKSVHKATIHKDIAKRFRKAAGLCNRLVVATEPLAKAYAHFTDEVVVQPNYLEAARWAHLRPARAEHSKPRVGWAGGVGHTGDLDLIVDVVRDTAAEIDWVFFGLCPEALKPVVKEFHPGVPLDQYPAKLASLDLDLAVAPLEDNAFNEAKSHLRLLEYGILGYPVICSDLLPYQGDFPVTRVANRYRDWIRALRDAVSDRDALRAQGDALRAKVLADWMMEDHLDTWLRAWLR